MATISDVVKQSGISKSTVSRVINNHPNVSKEKREKVLRAMEELSYTPNLAARKMRGEVKSSIGLIIPRVVNPFFSYLMDAIEQKASEHGMQVVFLQTREQPEKELEFLKMLELKQIDGLIFTSIENDLPVLRSFKEYGPLVFCNEYLDAPDIPVVRIDNEKAAYDGTTHLIARGYSNIAYCTGGLFAEEGKDRDRNRGFQRALKEAGLSVNPEWVFTDKHTMEDGAQVLGRILAMTSRPDAIFTGSDEVAAGITAAAREHEIRIPDQLAVLGFDNQPLSRLTFPQLSTVEQPVKQMGELAAELMIDLFEGKELRQAVYELPVSIIQREST
ncbi:LacI family DNA-binding transcriptional regulator [Bacillus daqingensis]|uniref:LacI family DNA-binding transcriptional regulator n=1 Tax=Bacillus daqingensis TaxID=872396 RepID=A0ABV9P1E0_9BACI